MVTLNSSPYILYLLTTVTIFTAWNIWIQTIFQLNFILNSRNPTFAKLRHYLRDWCLQCNPTLQLLNITQSSATTVAASHLEKILVLLFCLLSDNWGEKFIWKICRQLIQNNSHWKKYSNLEETYDYLTLYST